jgi:hypothetical protein
VNRDRIRRGKISRCGVRSSCRTGRHDGAHCGTAARNSIYVPGNRRRADPAKSCSERLRLSRRHLSGGRRDRIGIDACNRHRRAARLRWVGHARGHHCNERRGWNHSGCGVHCGARAIHHNRAHRRVSTGRTVYAPGDAACNAACPGNARGKHLRAARRHSCRSRQNGDRNTVLQSDARRRVVIRIHLTNHGDRHARGTGHRHRSRVQARVSHRPGYRISTRDAVHLPNYRDVPRACDRGLKLLRLTERYNRARRLQRHGKVWRRRSARISASAQCERDQE